MFSSPFVSSRRFSLHNCVYYWDCDHRRWQRAVLVHTSIGAPDGPPKA